MRPDAVWTATARVILAAQRKGIEMSTIDGVMASNRRGFSPWLLRYWAAILLAVIALSYGVAVTLMHTKALSPIDEWIYSDYLDKVPTQVVVRQGEAIGATALDRIACDGVFPYGEMGAACRGNYSNIAAFPYSGRTSADAYTPAYFVVTWSIGGVLHLVTGLPQLTAWRLTGPLWFAATLVVLAALFRLYRVPSIVSMALGMAFIASPFSWWTYTFVSTDAPAAFFGALLLLLVSQHVQGRNRAGWIVAISALAVVFKVTNILAVGLVALYLVANWVWEQRSTWTGRTWTERRSSLRSSLRDPLVAIAAVLGAVIVEVGWLLIRTLIAVDRKPSLLPTEPLGLQAIGEQLANFLPNSITSNVIVAGGNGNYALPVFGWAVAPLSWICIAGVLGAVWSSLARGRRYGPLILTTAIAAVFFAPALAIVLTVATHSYFPLPSRYGAALLPAFLLVTAIMMRRQIVGWLFLAYAFVLGIGMIHLTATYVFM